MTQEELIVAEVPVEKFDLLSREELIQYLKLEQDFRVKLQKEVVQLRALSEELKQKRLELEDNYLVIKNKFYGKSSERSPKSNARPQTKKEKRLRVLLPSERYPDAPLIERDVTLENLPDCSCCGTKMEDSGMTEDSEFLTVIPKQYVVIRQKRHKYRCGKCHGDLQTAPAPPRIKSGSAYSDEMIVDVAMTKYCDLVPIERYAAIAGREGLKELPSHSLIESTHYLAARVKGAYAKLFDEIRAERVLHADETPHRMLEGDKKSSWFLWGFSGQKTSYFECHPTRSGDVASALLVDSKCEYLVSDVYSGYGKAVRETNEERERRGGPKLLSVYCNAHCRRRFREAAERFPELAQFFIDQYEEIYRIEGEAKSKPPDEVLARRREMKSFFDKMKERALAELAAYSSKSSVGKAMSYLLKNFAELTLFLGDARLPIDNNPQERLLRNPVVGRKTWYGTHSKQGAETAAILFSLVESCKLNQINPRTYFKRLVEDLHVGLEPYTPHEFKRASSALA